MINVLHNYLVNENAGNYFNLVAKILITRQKRPCLCCLTVSHSFWNCRSSITFQFINQKQAYNFAVCNKVTSKEDLKKLKDRIHHSSLNLLYCYLSLCVQYIHPLLIHHFSPQLIQHLMLD